MSLRLFSLLAALLLIAGSLLGAEYFVDNVKGDDEQDGSKAAPFRTIEKALSVMAGGDTLRLVPNETPYAEPIEIRHANLAGTAEQPTVIDGQGAVLDRRIRRPASSWKDEGDGVFSMPLRNNAWVMDRQGYWSAFPIVFFDGEPAPFRTSREGLTPLSYFLFKSAPDKKTEKRDPRHNTLYVRLPAGKTPDDVRVETVGLRSSVYVGADHVTVRNLTSMYASADGFSTGGHAKGIVFENIQARYNMDQGISNHGTETTVRKGRFDHNAGSGIVDVYPECRVTYEDCLIESNAYRGGVEFLRGVFAMRNCVIRNNPNKNLLVTKGAKATLENCLLVGDGKTNGITLHSGCALTLTRCTLFREAPAIRVAPAAPAAQLHVTGSAFLDCSVIYTWRERKGAPGPDLQAENNVYTPGAMTGMGEYDEETWSTFNETFGEKQNSRMQLIPVETTEDGAPILPDDPALKDRGARDLPW